MTVHTAYDDRAVWVPRLSDWWEQGRDHYTAAALAQRRNGYERNAQGYDELARAYQRYADRARVLLVPAHNHTPDCPITDCADWLPTSQAVGLADACAGADEPPHQLVPFVDWLRGKLGRYLPWVPAEAWQTIGYALLMCRPGWRP